MATLEQTTAALQRSISVANDQNADQQKRAQAKALAKQLASALKSMRQEQPQNKGGAELAQGGDMLGSIKQSIQQNQGMARQNDYATASRPSNKKARNPVALNTLNEIIQGATFGYSDEASAAAAALVASGLEGADFADAYQNILEGLNQEQEAFRDDEKALAIGAQAVGGLASGGAGIAKTLAAQAGKGLIKKGIATGVAGATGGAVAGSGFAEQGEKLEGAGKGAAVGFVAAPIAAVTGAGASRGFQGVKGAIADKRAIKKILQERASGGGRGDTRAIAAGFKLNKNGKVVPDAAQRAAMNQGIDAGTVSLASGANKTTRRKMKGMVNLMQQAKGDKVFAGQHRTEEILGKSLNDRVSLIAKANKIAGKRVDLESKKLIGETVDYSDAMRGFEEDLAKIGVKLPRSGGRITPDFSGARVKYNAASKTEIGNIIREVELLGGDAKKGHELKKIIDDIVTYGKTSTGLAGEGEKVLKKLRTRIDDVLDSNFDGYNKANTLYAKTVSALDDMQSAAGGKINIREEDAAKGLGQLSRGIMSNNRGRPELIKAIKGIENTAEELANGELGKKFPSVFKRFDDDIIQLGTFSQELQKRFGVEAGTSIGGIGQTVAKTGAQAARGDTLGVALDVIDSATNKISGISDDNAFKALKSVLTD